MDAFIINRLFSALKLNLGWIVDATKYLDEYSESANPNR
jgi:hypothetical protein